MRTCLTEQAYEMALQHSNLSTMFCGGVFSISQANLVLSANSTSATMQLEQQGKFGQKNYIFPAQALTTYIFVEFVMQIKKQYKS